MRSTSRTLTLRTIGPDAAWDDELMTFAWRDLTRVDFGGDYEDALALVAGEAATSGSEDP